jgi:predicted anti-sigma-YlaC factor YlaD
MKCRDLQTRLLTTDVTKDAALAEHLGGCPGCRDFAQKWTLLRGALGPAATTPEPDAGFSARVMARLPQPSEMLGWAALRALPAAVLLALVLAGLGAAEVPPPVSLLVDEPSSSQLLAWSVQEPAGDLR